MHDLESMSFEDLAALVASSDVELPAFTDEELLVVGPASPAWRVLPEPGVRGLDDRSRQEALRTALRSLHARGFVQRAAAGAPSDAVHIRGPLALVHSAHHAASTIAVVETPDDPTRFVWLIQGGEWALTETVDHGVHRFVLRSRARAAAWLADRMSLEVGVGDGTVDLLDVATDVGESIRRALADGHPHTTVQLAYVGDGPRRGHLTILEWEGRVVLLSSSPGEEDGAHVVQGARADRAGAARLLAEWLRPERDTAVPA